jgi:hypothetical protein
LRLWGFIVCDGLGMSLVDLGLTFNYAEGNGGEWDG